MVVKFRQANWAYWSIIKMLALLTFAQLTSLPMVISLVAKTYRLTTLKNHLAELQAIEVPVILVCDIGMQAGAAVQLINRPNFMRLEGGIQGYQSAGLAFGWY